MKISAFVLLLSLLSNLSFASLSEDTLTMWASTENLDTVSRDALQTNLLGDWMNIGQNKLENGFASLNLLANGKFEGSTSEGKRVCGFWELSADGLSLAFHKVCEKTGELTGTVLAQIELMDGHMLTLKMPNELGGQQTFIQ